MAESVVRETTGPASTAKQTRCQKEQKGQRVKADAEVAQQTRRQSLLRRNVTAAAPPLFRVTQDQRGKASRSMLLQ